MSSAHPETPTPTEMTLLLQFCCMINGHVLACDGWSSLRWSAMTAEAWHERYGDRISV